MDLNVIFSPRPGFSSRLYLSGKAYLLAMQCFKKRSLSQIKLAHSLFAINCFSSVGFILTLSKLLHEVNRNNFLIFGYPESVLQSEQV